MDCKYFTDISQIFYSLFNTSQPPCRVPQTTVFIGFTDFLQIRKSDSHRCFTDSSQIIEMPDFQTAPLTRHLNPIYVSILYLFTYVCMYVRTHVCMSVYTHAPAIERLVLLGALDASEGGSSKGEVCCRCCGDTAPYRYKVSPRPWIVLNYRDAES